MESKVEAMSVPNLQSTKKYQNNKKKAKLIKNTCCNEGKQS